MKDVDREAMMRQALELAQRGAGRAAPNPMVGAVIVREGQILGQGFHEGYGRDHAEVNALNDCRQQGHDPAGATLFVTLEPCCHIGKTPPCTEAVMAAGPAAVEIATLDDNPQVAGQGRSILREAGIEVRTGLLEKEARRLNGGYFHWQRTARPRVILKWARSADGKVAWLPGSQQRWITGEAARRHVQQVRSGCGAVLVGIGTVQADDPLLNVRGIDKAYQPRRVVLDSRLRIDLNSRLVKTAREFPLLVYTSINTQVDIGAVKRGDLEKIDALQRAGVDVCMMPAGLGGIELRHVLEDLGRRGVLDLLVEGGPTVLRRFFGEGLGDELMVYQSPQQIGAAGRSFNLQTDDLDGWRQSASVAVGDDSLLRWEK